MSDYSPSDALPTIQNLTSRVRELEAELADLRASSVVYKVRCETCGGSGLVDSDESHLRVYCPDCDNGWQLAEGVEWINISDGAEDEFDGLFIPARLIEGEA